LENKGPREKEHKGGANKGSLLQTACLIRSEREKGNLRRTVRVPKGGGL